MEETRKVKGFPEYEACADGTIIRQYKKGQRVLKGNRITLSSPEGVRATTRRRVVYETFFGEIPDGYIVTAKNGIKNDCSLENIGIVPRSAKNPPWSGAPRKPIRKVCLSTGDITVYPSIRVAASKNHYSPSGMHGRISRGGKSVTDNYRYEYDTDSFYA